MHLKIYIRKNLGITPDIFNIQFRSLKTRYFNTAFSKFKWNYILIRYLSKKAQNIVEFITKMHNLSSNPPTIPLLFPTSLSRLLQKQKKDLKKKFSRFPNAASYQLQTRHNRKNVLLLIISLHINYFKRNK